MPQQRNRLRKNSRIPLTITLNQDRYEFVVAAAASREFRSLDEFFEAALKVYERHMSTVQEYLELQEAKGLTRDEAMCAAQCEIVFTRTEG
jgi:hypothetical protein